MKLSLYEENNAQGHAYNNNGKIDVNYYINKARSLRNEAIRSYGVKINNSIKAKLGYMAFFFQSPKQLTH